jgi:hypothetical protein
MKRREKECKGKEGKLSTTNATNISLEPKTGIRCDRP